MAHASTILAQILKFVPRHEFNSLAREHHTGQKLRKTSRWDQFVAIFTSQLSGRQSLRDIEANQIAQAKPLYHAGAKPIARSSLARLNEQQPSSLYEALFNRLLRRCQPYKATHGFKFKNPLYSLDASLIELSLKIFPWADHNQSRAAVKLHVGLNHSGHLPEFVALTDGNVHDVRGGREFSFPKGSIVVCDKGYLDYSWYKSLTNKGIFFVTRQRTNAKYRVIERLAVCKEKSVTSDQLIELTGNNKNKELGIQRLRRIGYRDAVTGKHYVFLTNHHALTAKTIADIYKDRWQIELFFKALKQNLKIRAFIGNSRNAVMTQIWIAMCCYLLLWYVKAISKVNWSIQRMMRVLQLNVFSRRNLLELLIAAPPPQENPMPQLCLRV